MSYCVHRVDSRGAHSVLPYAACLSQGSKGLARCPPHKCSGDIYGYKGISAPHPEGAQEAGKGRLQTVVLMPASDKPSASLHVWRGHMPIIMQ